MKIDIDLIRGTEAAAIQASKWIGSGKKEKADYEATEAMKEALDENVHFAGKVVMGEGKKDKSFGLFPGETVGKKAKLFEGSRPSYSAKYGTEEPYWNDVAVDPIEGTTPTVTSGPEAMSTIAVSGPSSMFHTEHFYMNRIVYGKKIRDKVELSLKYPLEENLRLASEATRKPISDLMVCVLNRKRHTNIIRKLRRLGVKIKILQDCDIAGAVASCLPTSNVDFLYGIGGSPEAVISAAAIRCLGGGMEAQVYSRDVDGQPDTLFSSERESWVPVGDILPIYHLVSSSCVFAATGITDGSILKGVKYTPSGPKTHSVFMKSDEGVVRWIETVHHQKNL